MASQNNLITVKCKETGEVYETRVNRKARNSYSNKDYKLSVRKYSKLLRKHVLFQETKKMYGSIAKGPSKKSEKGEGKTKDKKKDAVEVEMKNAPEKETKQAA